MLKIEGESLQKREKKLRLIEDTVKLIKSNKFIAIASIKGLRAQQLQEMRTILRKNNVDIKVTKNKIFQKAIEKCSKDLENLELLLDYLKDQNAFIFTNENPFIIQLILEKNKVFAEAKIGDIAQNDITIPAGNTGLSPGPIISKFNKLKIPIKIEEGSIWITKDTIVAKKGEKINPDLVDLLKRLNIKPMEIKLNTRVAYYNGRIISGDQLKINIEEYRQSIINAVRAAYALSISAIIPTNETIIPIITKAEKIAKSLAIEIVTPDPQIMKTTITMANNKAIILAQKLVQVNPNINIEGLQSVTAAPTVEAKEKEEKGKKEEEKKEEEEVAEGLASLFG
ncbi:MAG: 50S ribosomal protein L10 [Candidatus Methanomethylicia archaeon]